jgi:iron complex transport system substrate-binding protein
VRLPTLRIGALAAAAGLVLVLSACGRDDDRTPAGPGGGTASAESAFPVTVDHRFGTTTIRSEPKRIVVVGLVEQDALLAVGVVPVATTEWFGERPGAIWPWASGKLGGVPEPAVLTDTDGVQFEKVAALRPDLILGLYSAMSDQDYRTLSKIAPTVAQPPGALDFGASWQDVTRTVGKAVGRPAQAARVVDDVQAKIAEARRAHPEFAGRTALMATTYEGYYVYGPQDARGRLLTDLGFRLPDGLAAVTGKDFGASLSKERTDLLDTDVLIWLVGDRVKDRAKVLADPLYARLRVKTEGRDIYLGNGELVGSATSFVTALSVPFLLDELVPRMAAAVDGNPATAVRPAS